MSYKISNITTKEKSELNIKNCTIKGNSTAYELEDGVIKKYSIINGEIDKSTEEKVEEISLTGYQLALIESLKGADGDDSIFENDDLENAQKNKLLFDLTGKYVKDDVYNISNLDLNEKSVNLQVKNKKDNSKGAINVEFKSEGFFASIGKFFKNLWNKITFSISDTLKKNVKGSTKQESNKEASTAQNTTDTQNNDFRVNNDRLNIKKSQEFTVTNDRDIIPMCNRIGVSFERLKMANPDINFDNGVAKGTKIIIPEIVKIKPGSVKSIRDISAATGVSENYIKDILFGIEGRKSEPDLTAYYDGVAGENHPKGYLTIGFGHTGRVFGKELTESTKITKEQAYEILAQDIINAKLDAIDYFGKDFNKAPQSVQDGIVDMVFNKGVDKSFRNNPNTDKDVNAYHLKDNLKKRDYVSAIFNLEYYTPKKGLKKRNYFRMISACRDLSPTQRDNALKKITRYYETVRDSFSGTQRVYIEKAWQNAKDGHCTDFF